MKQTLTINLNGIVFHIDDDAYQTLQKYIADIDTHLGDGDDAKEIMADVEARMAELFSNMLETQHKEVVTLEMVNTVMNTMGNPDDFGDNDEKAFVGKSANKRSRWRNRRFYRDPERALLGGVAAGIASYLGWDVVAVRILLIVLTIAGLASFTIPAYIIIWIVAPEALTAAQRLEMQGEDVTVESIKNEFNNAKNYIENEKFQKQAKTIGQRLGKFFLAICKICFTIIGAFIGFIAFIIVGAIVVALIAALIGVGGIGLSTMVPFAIGTIPIWLILSGILVMLLAIGMPIYMCIYALIKYIRTKKGPNTRFWGTTFCIWLISLFGALIIGLTVFHFNSPEWDWNWKFDNFGVTDSDDNTYEDRTVDAFHSIKVTGAAKLELTQNPNQMLQVSALAPYLEDIKTEVCDSILYITNNNNTYTNVEINISIPEIRSIKVEGAGSVESTNTIQQPMMNLDLAGASKVNLDLQIDSLLEIDAAGASKIDLTGYAKKLDLDVAGASKVDAESCKTMDAKVHCAGGSKIDIWCENDLKVQAYGASKVTYKGNPNVSERIAIGASRIKND